jgi:hypothetical protein
MRPIVSSCSEHDRLVERIYACQPLLDQLRRGFARCCEPLSAQIADTFNNYRYLGNPPKPQLHPSELKGAFERVLPEPLRIDPFSRLVGRARGTNHFIDLDTGVETSHLDNFTVWDPTEQRDGACVQRASVSEAGYYATNQLPDLATKKVDVIVSVYRPDLGITSWASLYRHGRLEAGFIRYELGSDRALWISRRINATNEFEDELFVLSYEWWSTSPGGGRRYSMLAMRCDVNFAECTCRVIGKTANEIRYSDHEPPVSAPLFVSGRSALASPAVAPASSTMSTLYSLGATLLGAAAFSLSVPFLAILALAQSSAVLRLEPGNEDPCSGYDHHFEDLLNKLEGAKDLLTNYRSSFAGSADGPIAEAIVGFLAKYRDVGGFSTIDVNVGELRTAFKCLTHCRFPFERNDFDKTEGIWTGSFGDFDVSSGRQISRVQAYSQWCKGVDARGGYVQRVIGSENFPFNSNQLPDLQANKVDLFVNFYREDLGITSWSSLFQHGRQVQPVVSYKISSDAIVWISQILTESMQHVPSQQNVFFISLEWPVLIEGRMRFCLVLFTMEVDFTNSNTRIFGTTFRKGYFDRRTGIA